MGHIQKTKTTHKKNQTPLKKKKKPSKKTPKTNQPNFPELEEASTIQSANVCSFLN